MSRHAKILIADDDRLFVEELTPVFENSGYEVSSAGNREEALRKIEAAKPDLILLDIMMEWLADGFEICHFVKHNHSTENIPVIAVSAFTNVTGLAFPSTGERYRYAPDMYIEKPVKPGRLLALAERLLKKHNRTAPCRSSDRPMRMNPFFPFSRETRM